MSLLSVAEAQAVGAGAGLSSADLQTVINREEAELIRRFGAHYVDINTTVAETRPGGLESIYLRRAVLTVSTVLEYLFIGDSAPQSLASTLYYVWPNQGRLTRIAGYGFGTGVWGPIVTVTYVPQDDNALRKSVLIELVRIGSEQTTAGSGTISGLGYSISGGGGNTSKEWDAARSAQYARLAFPGV